MSLHYRSNLYRIYIENLQIFQQKFFMLQKQQEIYIRFCNIDCTLYIEKIEQTIRLMPGLKLYEHHIQILMQQITECIQNTWICIEIAKCLYKVLPYRYIIYAHPLQNVIQQSTESIQITRMCIEMAKYLYNVVPYR